MFIRSSIELRLNWTLKMKTNVNFMLNLSSSHASVRLYVLLFWPRGRRRELIFTDMYTKVNENLSYVNVKSPHDYTIWISGSKRTTFVSAQIAHGDEHEKNLVVFPHLLPSLLNIEYANQSNDFSLSRPVHFHGYKTTKEFNLQNVDEEKKKVIIWTSHISTIDTLQIGKSKR